MQEIYVVHYAIPYNNIKDFVLVRNTGRMSLDVIVAAARQQLYRMGWNNPSILSVNF